LASRNVNGIATPVYKLSHNKDFGSNSRRREILNYRHTVVLRGFKIFFNKEVGPKDYYLISLYAFFWIRLVD
jgi:hypothetical protein